MYLVDDGGVLEVPQVEHAYGAVGAHRREHVATAARAAERDVVDLLWVRDRRTIRTHSQLYATNKCNLASLVRISKCTTLCNRCCLKPFGLLVPL